MSRISRVFASVALAATAFAISPAAAVVVPSNQTSDTIIGSVVAGQSYTVAIAGVSTLCLTCNGGGPLSFNSNGVPIGPLFPPYTGFGPNGSPEDPSTPGLDYGIAGPNFNLGALVFILANPFGNAIGTSFSLQNGQTFTAAGTGTLNAIVNDTNYSDNAATGFSVTLVSAAAAGDVPEPATWGMMILGFGLVGAAARRRRGTAAAVAA